MDFRDSCISSFFLHTITILLLAVVSQYNLKQYDSLVVTLSAETFTRTISGEQPGVDQAQEVIRPEQPVPAREEIVARQEEPDDASVISEEEPAEMPETAQPPEEAPQVTNAVPPGSGQDTMALARMQHLVAIHTRVFVETTAQSIQRALRQEIASESSSGLNEGSAQLTFYFNDKGGIGEVWGSSDSEKLKTVLARIDWKTMPSPGDFRFKMDGLRVGIKIEQGEPALFFFAL